jgi:hypothetical protein
VSVHKPVLFFISEAYIKSSKNYKCLEIPGYNLEVSKTLQHGMARSMVYIRLGSGFERDPQLEVGNSEMIVVSNRTHLVCGVYGPFKTVCNKSKTQAF